MTTNNKMTTAVKEVMAGAKPHDVATKHKLDEMTLLSALSEEQNKIAEIIKQAEPAVKKITVRAYEKDADLFSRMAANSGDKQTLFFHKMVAEYAAAHPALTVAIGKKKVAAKDSAKAVTVKKV